MNSRPFLVLTVCLFALAVAMSLYVWQLRERAVSDSMGSAAPPTITPPGAGTPKQVTLWVAYDDVGIVRAQNTSIPLSAERQRRAEEIIRALLATYTGNGSPHRLPPGSDVRNVYFVDPGLVVVDLHSELANGQTSGILSEDLTVASLVQTLSANFQEISRVQLLVNGKEADTLAGHADLSSPYDIQQISELVKGLAPK